VQEIVARLFNLLPFLTEELDNCEAPIIKTLKELGEKVARDPLAREVDLLDILRYLLDTIATLRAFFIVYPPGTHSFIKTNTFVQLLVYIYEVLLPILQAASIEIGLDTFDSGNSEDDETYIAGGVSENLSVIRGYILDIVYTILSHYFVEFLSIKRMGKNSPCERCKDREFLASSEEYVDLLSNLSNMLSPLEVESLTQQLSNLQIGNPTKKTKESFQGSFVRDYDKKFQLQNALQIFKSQQRNFDVKKLDALILFLGGSVSENSTQTTQETTQPTTTTTTQQNTQTQQNKQNKHNNSQNSNTTPNISQKPISEEEKIKRQSLITQVKELFPELGDGFIDICLHFFNDSHEAVINNLLEGSLPPELSSIDRKLPFGANSNNSNNNAVNNKTNTTNTAASNKESKDKGKGKEQPDERRNIFSGDQFDVMTNDSIDMSRVWKGKKSVLESPHERLETREYMKKFLDREYEDEYDDSLDEFGTHTKLGEGEGSDIEEEKKEHDNSNRNPNILDNDSESDEEESEEKQWREGRQGTANNASRSNTQGASNRGRGGKSAAFYKHKNHHRKDAAFRKYGKGLLPQ